MEPRPPRPSITAWGRWGALTCYLEDGAVPIDNNWVENQIRPVAIGRNNWLFADSLRAGQRAAAVMSLIHLARTNGHDVYRYLRDILERLPTQPHSRIGELLPHRWSRYRPLNSSSVKMRTVKMGWPVAYAPLVNSLHS